MIKIQLVCFACGRTLVHETRKKDGYDATFAVCACDTCLTDRFREGFHHGKETAKKNFVYQHGGLTASGEGE